MLLRCDDNLNWWIFVDDFYFDCNFGLIFDSFDKIFNWFDVCVVYCNDYVLVFDFSSWGGWIFDDFVN